MLTDTTVRLSGFRAKKSRPCTYVMICTMDATTVSGTVQDTKIIPAGPDETSCRTSSCMRVTNVRYLLPVVAHFFHRFRSYSYGRAPAINHGAWILRAIAVLVVTARGRSNGAATLTVERGGYTRRHEWGRRPRRLRAHYIVITVIMSRCVY